MLFASLHEKLIARVRYRIRSGEITERGFAKLTGLSQPHLHNVLKGVRSLSTESADLIFRHLGISIADLLDSGLYQRQTPSLTQGFAVQAPHLEGVAGPFEKLKTESRPNVVRQVPHLTGASPKDPAWVTLGHDPDLFPYFQDNDVVLIDRTSKGLVLPDDDSVYLVETHNGTLVRALRLAGNRLYLVTPKTASEPRLWIPRPLDGRKPGEVIFGRLIFLQRELRADLFNIAGSRP